MESLQPQIERFDNSLAELSPQKTLNINVGVLGHIDSGKTSLCKALSTIASTAGFDKNPQSKERGITVDLGFSAFIIRIPEWFMQKHQDNIKSYEFIQFTLVDCPGHASLMKTIIGGASIIDMMMLVIDAQKLIQTQTAECIVLGEILMDKLIVALNKVDMFEESKRNEMIETQCKKLQNRFGFTRFGSHVPIIPCAAAPRAGIQAQLSEEEKKTDNIGQAIGITDLINSFLNNLEIPDRVVKNQPFLFSIDHCFQIKGQGTVLTGTVLSGSVKQGDTIELPALKQEKKIKSMQMFRKPVTSAKQGDRLGICVAQLDSSLIERGIATTPKSLLSTDLIVALVKKIPYFTEEVKNKAKFHITIGHQTVIGQSIFFTAKDPSEMDNFEIQFSKAALMNNKSVVSLDTSIEYQFVNDIKAQKLQQQKKPQEEEKKGAQSSQSQVPIYYSVIKLEKEIFIQPQSLLIASKLDKDISAKQCRLAFYGQVISLGQNQEALYNIRIAKEKVKVGKIDRIMTPSQVLVKDIFKKETAPEVFMNKTVTLMALDIEGVITGTFGKSGKQKVDLKQQLTAEQQEILINTEVQLKVKVYSKELAKLNK
ncbi:selenocysteine-specific elongation factor [Stylonychia lemnae]|uniref:Selenocysteine-specific elongation factor n=1 Tax=Stylonychia lemnae TaxID=5949 RepID=A0A078A574_STYLE|nr:selenocysteine-specific elongation factor [Stylonychia lemnae]|eukprot:CDW76735.1 selenocysteine-specific elongation factor [Stylonychia lemnae]